MIQGQFMLDSGHSFDVQLGDNKLPDENGDTRWGNYDWNKIRELQIKAEHKIQDTLGPLNLFVNEYVEEGKVAPDDWHLRVEREDTEEGWESVKVPNGSESSMDYSINWEQEPCCLLSTYLNIFGNLRDVDFESKEDHDKIDAWIRQVHVDLKEIGFSVRYSVVRVQCYDTTAVYVDGKLFCATGDEEAG
jgi:hypothetical protein